MVGDNLDGEFKTTSKCLKERAEDSSAKGWADFLVQKRKVGG